ncbi:hypothetical protein HK101_003788 [Irineochytrium annulatum]|nr:hypothetical protein HK101_003788 [Irineochytrium annulatum]
MDFQPLPRKSEWISGLRSSIQLMSTVHVAGSPLKGLLEIECSRPNLRLGEIMVEICGVEVITDGDEPYSEQFFTDSYLLQADPVEGPAVNGFWKAKSGKFHFPFAFDLPSDAPSSFVFKGVALLKYTITSYVQYQCGGKVGMIFENREPIVVELRPTAGLRPQPAYARERKTFSKCQGHILVEGRIKTDLFSACSNIPVEVTVTNESRRKVSGIRLALVRTARCLRGGLGLNALDGPSCEKAVLFQEKDYFFEPGDIRTVCLNIIIPESMRTVNGSMLAEVSCSLQISVGKLTSRTPDVGLSIPLRIYHSASLDASEEILLRGRDDSTLQKRNNCRPRSHSRQRPASWAITPRPTSPDCIPAGGRQLPWSDDLSDMEPAFTTGKGKIFIRDGRGKRKSDHGIRYGAKSPERLPQSFRPSTSIDSPLLPPLLDSGRTDGDWMSDTMQSLSSKMDSYVSDSSLPASMLSLSNLDTYVSEPPPAAKPSKPARTSEPSTASKPPKEPPRQLAKPVAAQQAAAKIVVDGRQWHAWVAEGRHAGRRGCRDELKVDAGPVLPPKRVVPAEVRRQYSEAENLSELLDLASLAVETKLVESYEGAASRMPKPHAVGLEMQATAKGRSQRKEHDTSTTSTVESIAFLPGPVHKEVKTPLSPKLSSQLSKFEGLQASFKTKKPFLLLLDDVELLLSQRSVIATSTSNLDAIDRQYRRNGRFEDLVDTTLMSTTGKQNQIDDIIKDMWMMFRVKEFEPPLELGRRMLMVTDAFSAPRGKTVTPGKKFEEIFGMDDVLDKIRKLILDPIIDRERFRSLNIAPPRGICLYGPSGVGKTALGLAIAAETGFHCIYVKGAEIRSKVVGESEKAIAKLFKEVKAKAPAVLFIDQIDSVFPKRGSDVTSENTGHRIVTTFLTEMDGLLSDLDGKGLVIAVTNRLDAVDPAVLRPGRMDDTVELRMPDEDITLSDVEQGINQTASFK